MSPTSRKGLTQKEAQRRLAQFGFNELESRKIFQQMNSHAIYRIAETIRVLLLMTLSILFFNFYRRAREPSVAS